MSDNLGMKRILLIGTGPMAISYTEVLKAMNKSFTVIGRGINSAKEFEEKTGIKPITGGLTIFLKENKVESNSLAIIAVGTEQLMTTLLSLIDSGITNILIEKPAAISIEELLENEASLTPFSKSIFVAYNRRFYSSVIEAQRLIEEDGGLKTMHFEFTEWAHKIEPLNKAFGVKENWFFANSTHVIDLAFFIGGKPKEWQAYSKSGSLNWHKKTNFVGAGITEKEVLFSYLSNWESAGRWGIELLTDKRRIYLRPLEGIGIQLKGTIPIVEHPFDDALDRKFKPGLFKQVEAFLNKDKARLIDCYEQIRLSKDIYRKML